MPSLSYLKLVSQLKLSRKFGWVDPVAAFAGVNFSIAPEHYQVRALFKWGKVQPVLGSLLSLCDRDTLFIDVGANVGLFSLMVASHCGSKALAFEPVGSTFQSLVRNCSLNPALPVVPLNVALGAGVNSIQITALPSSGINHVLKDPDGSALPIQWALQFAVDQLGIDKLLAAGEKLVIKIDVERHEFEVLQGAVNLLRAEAPIALCVEVDDRDVSRLSEALPPEFRPFNPDPTTALKIAPESMGANHFYANDRFLERYTP